MIWLLFLSVTYTFARSKFEVCSILILQIIYIYIYIYLITDHIVYSLIL